MAFRPTQPPAQTTAKSPFFQQRDALVNDIAVELENVLQNINKLNRSLEGVIAVGNEFGAVEALWSQFEGVMAQEPEGPKDGEDVDAEEEHAEEEGRDVDDGVADEGQEEDKRRRR